MKTLHGKTLVVMGGSSGIGLRVAQRAADEGADLIVMGRNPQRLAQTHQHFMNAIPLRRTAEIDEVASAYIFLMTNGFITGQHIAVDGGIMLG